MKMIDWILPLANILLAPFLFGVINRIKALFAGRRGTPLFQVYYDIFKLLQKGTVYSRTTGGIFRIAPVVVLSSIIIASLMVPWGNLPTPVSFPGDVVLFAYLLGLARFVTVLAALDTGSSFEGMGASREVFFGALVEPSIFIGLLALAVQSDQTGLAEMFMTIRPENMAIGHAPLFLIACSWMIALLAENSRIPVDDPNTHLELTMIHEAMVLDNSGPDLGFILYGSVLKLWIFGALIVNLLIPFRLLDVRLHAPVFVAAMLAVAVVVGTVESIMARMRFRQIPNLLIGSCSLGVVALILMIMGGRV